MPRTALARHGALAICFAAAACGGGPAAPTAPPALPPPLPAPALSEGRYQFSVLTPPDFEGCSPVWEQALGASRSINLTLTREQREWVGRPISSFYGDVVLRLREALSDSGEVSLSGTVQGTGVVVRLTPDAATLGVSFEPQTVVSGTLAFGIAGGVGRMAGSIVFIDARREPMTCSAVDWLLLRDPS